MILKEPTLSAMRMQIRFHIIIEELGEMFNKSSVLRLLQSSAISCNY